MRYDEYYKNSRGSFTGLDVIQLLQSFFCYLWPKNQSLAHANGVSAPCLLDYCSKLRLVKLGSNSTAFSKVLVDCGVEELRLDEPL